MSKMISSDFLKTNLQYLDNRECNIIFCILFYTSKTALYQSLKMLKNVVSSREFTSPDSKYRNRYLIVVGYLVQTKTCYYL